MEPLGTPAAPVAVRTTRTTTVNWVSSGMPTPKICARNSTTTASNSAVPAPCLMLVGRVGSEGLVENAVTMRGETRRKNVIGE